MYVSYVCYVQYIIVTLYTVMYIFIMIRCFCNRDKSLMSGNFFPSSEDFHFGTFFKTEVWDQRSISCTEPCIGESE